MWAGEYLNPSVHHYSPKRHLTLQDIQIAVQAVRFAIHDHHKITVWHLVPRPSTHFEEGKESLGTSFSLLVTLECQFLTTTLMPDLKI